MTTDGPPTDPMSPEAIGAAFLACVGRGPRFSDLERLEIDGKTPEDVARYIRRRYPDPDITWEKALAATRLAADAHSPYGEV